MPDDDIAKQCSAILFEVGKAKNIISGEVSPGRIASLKQILSKIENIVFRLEKAHPSKSKQ
jgi:hypothetical protein